MTFPLWDWEAKRFMKWQKEVNVDARIKPLRAIFDLNSGKAIIMTYFMDSENDACPLLKDNKCSIYHTKRAYVCRQFPLNRSPFTMKEKIIKEELFGECGAMEKILPQVPDDFEKMIKFLSGTFPDGSFENAVQNDMIVEWSNKMIVDIIKRKIIRPAINYPYGFLMKRIQNAKKIDFTDFLVESGQITGMEMEDLINEFDRNKQAGEKIRGFIASQ
jgi:Fe-S-cluster containining protein